MDPTALCTTGSLIQITPLRVASVRTPRVCVLSHPGLSICLYRGTPIPELRHPSVGRLFLSAALQRTRLGAPHLRGGWTGLRFSAAGGATLSPSRVSARGRPAARSSSRHSWREVGRRCGGGEGEEAGREEEARGRDANKKPPHRQQVPSCKVFCSFARLSSDQPPFFLPLVS